MHDVGLRVVGIPQERKKRSELATDFSPLPGDFGRFVATGGVPASGTGRNHVSPATARISTLGKVDIIGFYQIRLITGETKGVEE